MPIYEEKLISPLAVRFSQQRIRSTFKDGYDVEETIKEITAVAGIDDYDLILEAPFPTIEIIRWSAGGRGAGKKDHWFTFDNRRLYCLQRIATEYWPKRVAVAVHVLYADAGAIRKKLDSRTEGLAVSIGHAFDSADELQKWAWRDAVQGRLPPGLDISMQVEDALSADDAKASVADLLEAPGPSLVRSIPKEATLNAAVAQPLQAASLTGLIGQLLDLKQKDVEQSCEQMSEGSFSTGTPYDSTNGEPSESDVADSPMLPPAQVPYFSEILSAGPPGTFFSAEASAPEPPPCKEGSLSGLTGQLMDLNTKERTDSGATTPESPKPRAPVAVSLAPLLAAETEEAQKKQWAMAVLLQRQKVMWHNAQMAQFQAARARQQMMLWAAHAAQHQQGLAGARMSL
jgi:hypothetical protein